jgi:hypothetical protein
MCKLLDQGYSEPQVADDKVSLMIPIADVEAEVESPLPTCKMPASDEITEEGFGFFRGTWFIGRVAVAEAQACVQQEGEIIELIDKHASRPEEYEQLATAIEKQDVDLVDETLRSTASASGLAQWLSDENDEAPLGGLEIGVAGLTYALSAVRCLTAASCRWHMTDRSWAYYPVVFFVAPSWRADILAELIAAEACGLAGDRGMLTVYGSSVRHTHQLAERILSERGRFRKNWTSESVRRWPPTRAEAQPTLF